VLVMDGGHLPTLLAKSQGVVVVNSTTGLSALHHGRPVTVLGSAIFDIAGLTFRGPLDRFWRDAAIPNAELFKAFRKVVLKRAQMNGSFFTDAGMQVAIDAALKKINVPEVKKQPVIQTRAPSPGRTLAVTSPIRSRGNPPRRQARRPASARSRRAEPG
jgi:capsular polysaccharide export protein